MDMPLKQSTRVVLLAVDVLLLLLFSWLAFGSLIPPLGNPGFWFYTALLSLLLGSRLVTPFYSKPVDVISYAVPAVVALFLVNEWQKWGEDERVLFVLAISYCALVGLGAFVQIFTKDARHELLKQFADSLRVAVDILGSPQVIFSVVMWFAIYAFHRSSADQLLWILAAWALTVAFSPIEGFLKLAKKLRYRWRPGQLPSVVGEVIAYQNPNIVLFRQIPGAEAAFGAPLMINDPHAPPRIAVALDYVGRDEGMLRRAVEIDAALPSAGLVNEGKVLPYNIAARIEVNDIECTDLRSAAILADLDSLVGIVAAETTIERLYFEVIKNEGLEEGRLVETFIGDKPVVYQIVSGLTKEEIVHQKNTYGYARAQAQKIGIWKPEDSRFELVKWLPSLNAPVFLKEEQDSPADPNAVGHFPRTNFSALFRSIPELVTHNTAILGILGIGKSSLAFELVERVLSQGIKVICLDLTDEYAEELKEFCYDSSSDELYRGLTRIVGEKGKKVVSKNVEEGGSKPAFASALDEYLERFIHNDLGKYLLVFNPSQYEIWRQDSKPYKEEASMASLSATEITQLFTEAALKACQKLGKAEKGTARVCVVYEEAHSLIPEWNAIVNEGDRSAVNGTARAILQGRKFGLGCILVTQRTANVTKTILNQCNTIFAMRTFDDTGKEFLSNYIGSDYASVLPSLQERQAVFFGKASKCENPILIRLNDRDAFKNAFRAKHPLPEAKAVEVATAKAEGIPAELRKATEFDDDIPF